MLLEANNQLHAPYFYGSGRRSPGFGWGATGPGAGFNAVVRPNRNMGASGGNLIKFNPFKPYSEEFADYLKNENQAKWQKALDKFEKGYKKLVDDIKFATSINRLSEIIDSLSNGSPEVVSDFIDDHSMLNFYEDNEDVEKVKASLLSGIEKWRRDLISQAERLDSDTGEIERYTYEGTEFKDR